MIPYSKHNKYLFYASAFIVKEKCSMFMEDSLQDLSQGEVWEEEVKE